MADETPLETRVAVLEANHKHHQDMIDTLRQDLLATKAMVTAMEDKVDRRFEDLRTQFAGALDGLRKEFSDSMQKMQDAVTSALQTAAANVPPKVMWVVAVLSGVAGMVVAGLGVYAALRGTGH